MCLTHAKPTFAQPNAHQDYPISIHQVKTIEVVIVNSSLSRRALQAEHASDKWMSEIRIRFRQRVSFPKQLIYSNNAKSQGVGIIFPFRYNNNLIYFKEIFIIF